MKLDAPGPVSHQATTASKVLNRFFINANNLRSLYGRLRRFVK